MIATVKAGADFAADTPRAAATTKYYGGVSFPNYDIWRDGRLLIMRPAPAPPPARRLIVVGNWTSELSRRAPR